MKKQFLSVIAFTSLLLVYCCGVAIASKQPSQTDSGERHDSNNFLPEDKRQEAGLH